MITRRTFAAGILGIPALLGQEQSEGDVQFRTTVDFVIAPVTVLDGDGDLVTGLPPHQFRLFDNGREQDIRVDESFQPISLVIAVQANSAMEGVLPQIQKIGSLIQPLVIGDQGEAAVLAFDARMRLMTDFSPDPDTIIEAVKKITPGSANSRLNDAVTESVRMLRNRPLNHRRVILLIGETRDTSSEARARQVLADLQLHNVLLYSVNVSRVVTTLTAKPQPPRPDPMPPAARPMPPNVPATPHTVAQARGTQGQSMEFVPLFVEIFRQAKAVFVDNPMEVYTKASGGAEFSFIRQRGLEEAIGRIGTELHSQYLISYNPNNREEGGFHEIRVEVIGRRDLEIRTRPGYWLGPRM
jgi:VWFA-related protein